MPSNPSVPPAGPTPTRKQVEALLIPREWLESREGNGARVCSVCECDEHDCLCGITNDAIHAVLALWPAALPPSADAPSGEVGTFADLQRFTMCRSPEGPVMHRVPWGEWLNRDAVLTLAALRPSADAAPPSNDEVFNAYVDGAMDRPFVSFTGVASLEDAVRRSAREYVETHRPTRRPTRADAAPVTSGEELLAILDGADDYGWNSDGTMTLTLGPSKAKRATELLNLRNEAESGRQS
jgi:hypothetical protein